MATTGRSGVALVALIASVAAGLRPDFAAASTLSAADGGPTCPHPSALDNATQVLDDLYTDLLSSVNASAWPDADAQTKLWRGLRRSADNRTVEPTTFASDGPLQIACFLQQSPEAMRLVAEAKAQIFEPFLAELRAGLSMEALEVVDRGVFRPQPAALHTVVLVFSEHPSLLDESDRAAWHAVSEPDVHALGTAVREPIEQRCALRLRLWGYAITADGSMLLLLEEASGGSSLLEMRDELQALGTASLGSLNTRPKKLIHVSAMRLLEWPFGVLNATESAHVQATIQKWTSALANRSFPTGEALPNIGFDGITARRVQLVRDEQWMMTRRKSYASYTFEGTPSTRKKRRVRSRVHRAISLEAQPVPGSISGAEVF